MNTEKINGESTPPAITSFSPACSAERDGVIELEVWLQRRQPFPCNSPPANDERQIAEPEWSVKLTLQPRILGSEIRIID